MTVKRIVANIATEHVCQAEAFYSGIFDLNLVMDLGWVQTYSSDGSTAPQVSIATEGGSGTQVPDLSIEVDNLDDVLTRVSAAGIAIEYGPTVEPWGVKRFYIRDPFNKLINVLEHS